MHKLFFLYNDEVYHLHNKMELLHSIYNVHCNLIKNKNNVMLYYLTRMNSEKRNMSSCSNCTSYLRQEY